MKGGIAPILFCLFFVGCSSTITKPEFDLKYQKSVFQYKLVGRVYYRGTKDGYDYFKFEPFGFGSERARVPEREVTLEKRFPITKNRDDWLIVSPEEGFPNIDDITALIESLKYPQVFDISVGGFLGASCRVELLDKHSVVYYHNPNTFTSSPETERTEISVSDQQWKEFREALEKANVWGWKEVYPNPGIFDGTQWSITIEYPDRSLNSKGDNAYPNKRQFEQFCESVENLLGGRPFR